MGGVPYSGKFSYGANFCIFRMKPRDTKIKTTKILTVEILTSNFERAIEHVEAASKRWGFITVFLAFERPSRLQWTRLHPLACYDNETAWEVKVSQFTEQQQSSLAGSGPARLATMASIPPTRRLFRNSCQQQRLRYQHCRRTLSPLCIASTENRKTTLICVRVVLGGVAMRRRIRKLEYENFC